MSSQKKEFKQRVFSAKSGNFRQSLNRPISGSSQTYSRKELIQNVYTAQSQAGGMRTASSKALSHRALLGLEKSKKIVVKQSRKKEELQEEIMRLKQTINQLMQELSQQKGKTESMRKKGQKYSKLLSIEFENETHWNSNTLSSHLVTGIKNTYDMLKNKYESLQEQHQLLLKKKNITKELEYITYIDVLEKENKTLNERLEKYLVPNLHFGGEEQERLTSSYVIAQLQANHEHLRQRYNEVSSRYQMCMETLKDRNKKIQFLEKLILQKDNNSHNVYKETKKLKDQVALLKQAKEKIQKDYEDQLDSSSKEIEVLKERLEKQKENYQQFIAKELMVRQAKIAQTSKQNEYLHEMTKELRTTNSELNKKIQQLKLNSKSDGFYSSTKKEDAFTIPAFHQLQMHYLGQYDKSVSNPTSRAEHSQGIYVNGKRIPQKADKKYHQNAIKSRKILLEQVTQIVQLAKLKLIDSKFSLSKVKKLFDADPLNHCSAWEQQYITMIQAKQILTFPPFSLNSADSQVLARYLVEDVQADYVYRDDFNENTRQIVKSILKTLLDDYPICTENSALDNEFKRFMGNYSKNLQSALTKIDSSGNISKKRFEETLKNLGMECSDDVKLLLLGRMSKNALSINQLGYKELFK